MKPHASINVCSSSIFIFQPGTDCDNSTIAFTRSCKVRYIRLVLVRNILGNLLIWPIWKHPFIALSVFGHHVRHKIRPVSNLNGFGSWDCRSWLWILNFRRNVCSGALRNQAKSLYDKSVLHPWGSNWNLITINIHFEDVLYSSGFRCACSKRSRQCYRCLSCRMSVFAMMKVIVIFLQLHTGNAFSPEAKQNLLFFKILDVKYPIFVAHLSSFRWCDWGKLPLLETISMLVTYRRANSHSSEKEDKQVWEFCHVWFQLSLPFCSPIIVVRWNVKSY